MVVGCWIPDTAYYGVLMCYEVVVVVDQADVVLVVVDQADVVVGVVVVLIEVTVYEDVEIVGYLVVVADEVEVVAGENAVVVAVLVVEELVGALSLVVVKVDKVSEVVAETVGAVTVV